MSKPGIPLDIVETARAVYAKLGRGSTADEAVIARALAAERERCADVADQHGAMFPATAEAASEIAAAIRKGAA